MDEAEILARIKLQKSLGENNVDSMKLEIESDIALIRGKKKKGKEGLIGSTLTANRIRAMIARSFTTKSPINIRSTQEGNERIAKAQNRLYLEDRDTPLFKALRYYKDRDKYTTGVAIMAKTGWDGKTKSNTWDVINPLLAVPDPFGDYFTGDYRYIGFYSVRTKEEMDNLGWDTSWCQNATNGEKERKKREQQNAGVIPQEDKELFDIFFYFEWEGEKVNMFVTNGDCSHILDTKTLETMPFAFFYWSPNGTFFGDRPANYTRDTNLWEAEMRNLQADKVRQEVYQQWIYNSDFVSGKDVGFGLNKKVPVKTGIDGNQVPLTNVLYQVPYNARTDNVEAFMQSLNQEITEALSIGPVALGSTPERREALGTNKLVQDNTDINLSLNEEMDSIGEQQFAILWYEGYRENFKDADKKIIYAGSSTGMAPIVLKKEDFIIEGNLSLEIETSKAKEARLAKEQAWRTQNAPLILQDPNINDSSKRITLRKLLIAGGAEMDDIEAEVPMTAQFLKQLAENEALKRGVYVDINPEDDDDQHLVAMGDIDPENLEMVMHQTAHIMQKISKGEQVPQQNNQMLNGAMSQAMSQAGSQIAKSNSLPQ